MDLTPDRLRTKKFTEALRGYDKAQVDDFLGRLANQLDQIAQHPEALVIDVGGIRLPAADLLHGELSIRARQYGGRRGRFSRVMRGYSVSEVDEFLHHLVEEYREHKQLLVDEVFERQRNQREERERDPSASPDVGVVSAVDPPPTPSSEGIDVLPPAAPNRRAGTVTPLGLFGLTR